jgi:hypothetical protein
MREIQVSRPLVRRCADGYRAGLRRPVDLATEM